MEIIDIILPVFLVIGLGYVLRLAKYLGDETNTALSRLVFYVAAPALLFHGTSQTPLQRSVNIQTLLLLAAVTVVIGVAVYIACARSSPRRRGVLAQGAHRSNMVFVGLPIITYAYGESALGPAAVLIGFMVVWYNLLAVLFLTLPHRQAGAGISKAWIDAAVKTISNPLILGCAGGLLISALGLSVPVAPARALDLVGRTALPLALVSVGAGLEFGKLRAEIAGAALVSFMKLVVYPAMVYAGLLALHYDGVDLEVPVILMATPTAVVSYIMAKEMDGDEKLAGAIVIGSTAASIVTLSGWLALLRFF
ncbi:MAG: AEC family transporter [Chitinivibrionia bacterium]|nr:AEC family transporter [Chitinivibrionia bacterium]